MKMNISNKTIDLVALTLAEKYKIHLQMTDFEDEKACVLQYMNTKWSTKILFAEKISKKNLPFLLEKTVNNPKFILITDYINETMGGFLKDKNIQYADSVGNLYLEEINNTLNLFIYRNDFKKIKESNHIIRNDEIDTTFTYTPKTLRSDAPRLEDGPSTSIRFKEADTIKLFTEKAGLQVLFAILCDESLITGSVRDLADKAGVGFGSAQRYKKALKDLQYLVETKQGWQLHKREKLIERWLIGYQEILKPKCQIGRFSALQQDWKNIFLGRDTYWSGEPAAELLGNYLETYHFEVYTNDDPENSPLSPDKKGNIALFAAFWRDLPFEEPFIVPILLVYADLMCSKSARNHEIAKIIYEKYLVE